MGNLLAAATGVFNWAIFIMACLTTLFLQVLSNLANDYGDSEHGADHIGRKGPSRMVQSGFISKSQMKNAIGILILLSLVSGLSLLYFAFNFGLYFWIFLSFGLLCIAAAITYTAGYRPYGYIGLGDISVFIFFGLMGVCGSYFLQTQQFNWLLILPATSCGLLSTGVLNVNNIRDIDSDKIAGKYSIPVRIGRPRAVLYHIGLLAFALVAAVVFVLLNFQSYFQLLFLLSLPLFLINVRAVILNKDPIKLDPYLKQLALSTLVFVLFFGLGEYLK